MLLPFGNNIVCKRQFSIKNIPNGNSFLCTDGVPSVKAFDTSRRFSFYRMMTMIPAVQKIIPSHSMGEYFSLRCITE